MIGQTVSRRCQRLAFLSVLFLSSECAPVAKAPHVGWSDAELSLERECQQGTIAACGELGRSLLRRPQPARRERERGLLLLELACGKNDRSSCTSLGMYYLSDDEGKASQARARDLLARMCEQDQGEACRGMALVRSLEDPLDKRGSRAFLEKACRLADAQGCEALAFDQMNEDSGNRTQALEELSIACSQGRRSSCHYLAQGLLFDPSRQQEGRRRLIENCEHGHSPSCSAVALLSAPLFVDRPNCAEAVKHAQRACVAKDEDGCAIMEACQATPPGDGGSAYRLEAACERRWPVACLYWADLKQHNQGAYVAPDRIRTAYALACRGLSDNPSRVACVRAASLELEAAKSAAEKDKMVEWLRKTCEDRASGEACCTLGQAYLKGETIPKDEERARRFRDRGCDLGRKECCTPLP